MCSNTTLAELNFVILKINGIDVSHLSQDEAVQMFLKCSDPIQMEMQRKCDTHNNHTHPDKVDDDVNKSNAMDTPYIPDNINVKLEQLSITPTTSTVLENNCASTITKETPTRTAIFENELLLTLASLSNSIKIKPKTATSATQTEATNIFALSKPESSVQEDADRIIEQEHNLFEQCLAPEIDIEEITLRKSDSNERLGLTVCYSGGSNNGNNYGALSGSDDNETCTEVYISDIQPDSIAGRDGRLRQGDQILQINGKDIKNKQETESLIAENNNAVTLLVSRYLYADEDDFNDPSVVDIDVEDDDDDEEEEYYDDNNLAYENCFITNDYINVVDELDKVLLAQAAQQTSLRIAERATLAAATVATPDSNAVYKTTESLTSADNTIQFKDTISTNKIKSNAKDTIDQAAANNAFANGEQNIKSFHLRKDLHQQPIMSLKSTSSTTATAKTSAIITTAAVAKTTSTKVNSVDYETEHIYETIPEDSESEPFYCSPYESSMYTTALETGSSTATDAIQLQQQKQRVAQWLGIKPHAIATTTATTAPRQSMRSSSGCGRSLTHYDASSFFTRNRNGTVRSAITTVTNGSSSSGGAGVCGGGSTSNIAAEQNDEHDNSSSAYNTGGSNNSVTPLILVINQNIRGGGNEAVTCNLDNDEQVVAALRFSKTQQRLQPPKGKITSPKNNALSLGKVGGGLGSCVGPIHPARSTCEFQSPEGLARILPTTAIVDGQPQQMFPSKTMYTNEANLHQTMLLQQHLFRQALTHQQQKQLHQQQLQQDHLQHMHCPQFTAPNLSQYHFVSSQEVSAVHMNTAPPTTVVVAQKNPPEESMVWKVKRRQDGTRYIVRRPARNRLLRHRSVRLNTERVRYDITTTEEDTISEVKTGRYWSKEDRKKHIERARERRQQHQQQQQQLDVVSTTGAIMSTMRIGDRAAKFQQQNERSAQQHQQLLQHQQQPSNIQPHRQNSTKILQKHYQLQFNSGTAPQQQQQFAISTISGNDAYVNDSSDMTKQVFLPQKSITSNLHICSPIETHQSGSSIGIVTTTTTTTAATVAVTTSSVDGGVYEKASGVVITQQTQNLPTATDVNKINHILSVTTV